MTASVRIRSLRAEHRARDDEGLRRIQAVQRQWLDGELEAALDRVASQDEWVIVRRLQVELPLLPSRTDGDNARAWADAVAAALERSLRRAVPGEVLRFAGRHAALQAFVRDALAGEERHDWAWQRIGLLSVGDGRPGASARRDALIQLLAEDAVHGVPLLRGLLDTPAWAQLLALLSDDQLRGLAGRVLARITERPDAAFDDALDATAARQEALAGEPATAAAPGTPSALLRASQSAAPTPARRLWVLRLGCLLAQPSLARRGAAAVDAWLAQALDEAAAAESSTSPTHEANRRMATAVSAPAAVRDAQAHRRLDGHHEPPPREPTDPASTALPDPTAAALAALGETDWGGLLLLLPLLPGCGALALLEDETCWPQGSLPLALHRLACHLLPLAADDAAALAFCGLAPDAKPPLRDEPITPAQGHALDDAAALLRAHLAERLPDWRGAALLERVARRRARVVADPGWFDIVFSLRDVCIELRRAALDLDPGFIPWLGIVLRIRYE